jgi:two-component system sensor kinase FixL
MGHATAAAMPGRDSDTGAWTQSDWARFRLASIVEASDDAIIGTDLNGTVTHWNHAADARFGYTVDEIVGRSITRVVPPDRIDEAAAVYVRIRQCEGVVRYETERRHRNWNVVPVSLTLSPIRDGLNRVIGVTKIVRDLRVPRRIHLELRRREALLRSILDTVADALIAIDGCGLIQSFSAAAERLFGFTAGEVIGRNVNVLMTTPYRREHDGYPARPGETGERHGIGTARIAVGRRENGTTFPMELVVEDANLPGEVLFTCVIRDLTERRNRERRLDESRAALIHASRLNELGRMVSAASHAVDQPLAAMANTIGDARQRLAAGDQFGARRAVERIAEQAGRAREIVRRHRELARQASTERRIENLPETIEEASALALPGVDDGLKLEIQVDDDASEAVIDKVQIQQVLMNLMRNAVEAMAHSERRELTVSATRAGAMIEIRVADTGPGLPARVRLGLFEPCVTTRPDGMGVDLSVCRAIVEAHGGELYGEDGDGGRTVFRLTVPRPGEPASGQAR